MLRGKLIVRKCSLLSEGINFSIRGWKTVFTVNFMHVNYSILSYDIRYNREYLEVSLLHN